MRYIDNCYDIIISHENIWLAWTTYRKGKRHRSEVRDFERNLEENLLLIRNDLLGQTYRHGGYGRFAVNDPKKRIISAPSVRDHIVHQAACQILTPFYEKIFLPYSFSCRKNKGTDKARMNIFSHLRKESKNFKKESWILHGDIEKCFDSICPKTLLSILSERIKCVSTMKLLKKIIKSYDSGRRYDGDETDAAKGIPLGNLTSQLFINIYLDKLDRFAKEDLRIKRYTRYADDFIIIGKNKNELKEISAKARKFLKEKLYLNFPETHEKIRSCRRGFETLGIRFLRSYYKTRPKTLKRNFSAFNKNIFLFKQEKIAASALDSSWQSTRDMLARGENFTARNNILNSVNYEI